VQFIAGSELQYFVPQFQAFQRDEKYSRLQHFRLVNIFHHVGKPAINYQLRKKIAARCTQQLHTKPRLNH